MADRDTDILLIGGGIASAMAAATLREDGFDGSILLVGRELDPPYHRPPASKGYLRGEHESKDDALVHPPAGGRRNGVELLTRTSVMDLDTAARTAKLSTKEEVGFDQALIATGAMVRRLSVDGAQLDGIHYLRALGNADTHPRRRRRRRARRLRRRLVHRLRGRRVADRARQARHDRHAGGRSARASASAPAPGATSARVLEEHGVEIVAPTRSRASRAGTEGDGERVARVVTAGGRELDAEAVICGVGAMPDVMLARKAGLTLGDLGGVLCDSRLRTSAERRLRRRRHLRVRQRRPRPRRAHRARGGRRRPGRDRRAQHARRRRAARRRPVLLLGPRRLGLARVRRARGGAGTRRSSAATSTTARSRSGTSRATACGRCCPSAARATSTARTS